MTASPDRSGRSTGRWDHVNHSLLFLEIASLHGPGGTESDREVARAPLHRVVRNAFADSDIPWSNCRHVERHDGVLVVIPPSVTTSVIVDRLIPHIQNGVRRYNREAAPVRMQLRASLHVGPVTVSPDGLSGQAIAAAARLLNTPELAGSDADLAVMVSSQVYETVIRHASGFADPTRYLEISSGAWLFAPEPGVYPRHWAG
ncbi:hypothetical protein [Lentzea albida]|uniref:Guanylate cyclase domain-containing protein n=1 Tax=Lentzea albida TaxID=65499 RepID=A0A1H9L972_9PSEU|nr:hypothetical protein [Lentzea albida]SER07848.1 hypothetical protein SAMN04488000_10618 [Lentzea albida]